MENKSVIEDFTVYHQFFNAIPDPLAEINRIGIHQKQIGNAGIKKADIIWHGEEMLVILEYGNNRVWKRNADEAMKLFSKIPDNAGILFFWESLKADYMRLIMEYLTKLKLKHIRYLPA